MNSHVGFAERKLPEENRFSVMDVTTGATKIVLP